AYAAQEAFGNMQESYKRLLALRELFFQKLDGDIFQRLSPENGTPYLLSVAAKGLRGAVIQQMLSAQEIFVGTGSACSSKKPFSRVMEACGYGKDVLYGVLRVSFSPNTTKEEVLLGAEAMNRAASELKSRL
ncbi:MAG: aminotransferase class V-fold PLP-dependent enzyme, partial [Clostridiales bacterium]|nr:aminotransferase class V-fold PLP-dependent enzyme [Clostridiales bacterium]